MPVTVHHRARQLCVSVTATRDKEAEESKMHYGVIGTGPVGATFAALLKASGQRVSLFDLDETRVEALKKSPLRIKGFYTATADFDEVYSSFEEFANNEPEVVIISVKTYSLESLLTQIKSSKLNGKVIISCQNGIDTEKEIARVLGEKSAFRIVLNFGVGYIADNEIRVTFLNEPHFFSCVSSSQVEMARRIVDEFGDAGINLEFRKNISAEIFKKAILNASLGSICALTRTTMSEAMSTPELLWLIRDFLRECMLVCNANGIDIEDDFVEKAIAYLSKGGDHKPSMLVDIENHRPTENLYLAGKLYEYAEKEQISTPVLKSISYLIHALEGAVMPKKHAGSMPE